MTNTQGEIRLSSNEYILSPEARGSFRLKQGRIQVYVAPFRKGKPAEPELFCEISDSDRNRAIPYLRYEDEAGSTWYILIKPTGGDAVLTKLGYLPTSVLYRQFLEKGGLTTYETLGFEKSMAAFYEEKTRILVTSTKPYLSENPADAYCLERGEVFVYIVPMEKDHPGQGEHYCDISDSDPDRTIPALVYKDRNHKNWRLMIKAASDEAVLKRLPEGADSRLHRQFLQRRKIATYEREGFENSLIEFYTRQIVIKNKGFLIKTGQTDSESRQKLTDVLKTPFAEETPLEHSENQFYQALQFLGRYLNISLIKHEELIPRCGKNPTLEEIARASHLICRKIVLDADWYRYDCGGFVGTLEGEVIACVQDRKGRYQVFRPSDESVMPLTEELAKQISPQAHSIGRTLPLKPLKKKDIFAFCSKSIRPRDLVPYGALVLLCSLIGVLLPTLSGMIYDDYIPIGNVGNLTELCLVMLTFMFGNLSFSIVKNLFGYRMTSRVANELQNAVYHRLFHLPESFFRDYDSADLAGRVAGIGGVAARYAGTIIISGISGLFSLVYLLRMFSYGSKLSWLSLGIYAVYLVFSTVITSAARKGQLRIAEAESQSGSRLYQYLNGVDKIRMAGVENRAMLSFMEPYARQQQEEIRLNRLVSVEEALTTVVDSVFSMVLYWFIVSKLGNDSLSIGSFVAFNSAFGAFTGALDSLVDEGLQMFQEREELKRFWAVFDAVPEDDDTKEVPGTLEGGLALEKVFFSYEPGGKNVLNNLSINVKPGEYVGIVGPSGCGKSTLLKLLLGFENPNSGMVLVDGKDLRSINKGAYRRQLGVVLQNGRLISGSIYENITITAPDASPDRVKEVVEQVGLLEDIQQMPMGLHTMLSENCNTISGGQQQRILIARAICGKPKILIFDEATSALDNVTQAAVSSSLDKMNVTRIVVAHRLSTIRNCDRILVMREGKVIQEGNYETLMEDRQGLFYALASRQIAD